MDLRSALYRAASILGWINAIAKGRIIQRIARVGAYRVFSGDVGRDIRSINLEELLNEKAN